MKNILYSPKPGLRWAARLLLALLALYVAYLLVVNVLLNTALGPSLINRKPEKFQMHWQGGSSWWPGRVALHQAALSGQVGNRRWDIQAEQVRGRIALLPLLHRELRVPWAHAHGVEGGVRRSQTRLPPAPAAAGGWRLSFPRIVGTELRRGHFDDLVLEGRGEAEFGFEKQLRAGPMQILPSQARFADASLHWRDQVWLRQARIEAGFSMARHTRAQAAGWDKLKLLEAELTLEGTTPGMRLALDAQRRPVVGKAAGSGRSQARLAWSRGQLQPGSVRWQLPLTVADLQGAEHHSALQAELVIDQDLHLRAKVPAQPGGVFDLDADLRATGRQLPLHDLHSLLPRTSGHVQGRWRFSSLAWIGALANAPWLRLEGAGDLEVDARLLDGKVAAGSRFSVPDVSAVAEVMGNRIEGSARAEGRFVSGPKGEALPLLDVAMQRFSIAAGDNPRVPYVQGRDLRLSMSAGEALADLRDSLHARLTFKGARFPDLRVYNRYLPNPHLRFEGGSGVISGDLQLDAAGEIASGWVRLSARRARMRAAGLGLQGDIDLDTRLRRMDLAQRNFAVDGSTIKLDRISFSEPGGETRSGWWARIHLPRARMDWDKPITVGGSAEIQMRDVGFLLSMFSRQREYPRWVLRLVDVGQAQVQGRVQWRDDDLVLDRLQARNDRFGLQARLRLRGTQRQGDLFASWGRLSMGMEVDGAQRRWHLLRARQWYESRPHLLP